MFPTIVHMENLKTLSIQGCPKILEVPNIQANMEGLVSLSKNRTEINVLPSSVGERCPNLISLELFHLKNLKRIQLNFDALKHLKELSLEGLIGPMKTRGHVIHLFLRGLQRLDLYAYTFNNVEIPSSIIMLSNLQELNLGLNDFSKLDFSLSQLTQLKHLNMSCCKKLLELPELPLSLTTLDASRCKSLTTFGDCHKNCRRLCKVSLSSGSMINDGDRLLESMIEVCIANENHYMLLKLTSVEIAKGFTPPILTGDTCTLQLPDNWCNDYYGFLMCVVMPFFYSARISIIGDKNFMDSKTRLSWEESDGDSEGAFMLVSFDSLRQTKWWDHTYRALEFDISSKLSLSKCSGFGVRLVEKKSRSGLMETSTNSTSFSCRSKLQVEHDSTSPSKIISYISFP